MVLFFLLSLFLDNRGVCLATKVLSCFRGLFCDFVPVHPRAFAGRRLCCYKDHWCILELQLILERSSLVLSIEADCRLGTAFGGGGGGIQILLVALSCFRLREMQPGTISVKPHGFAV
ncbi:hypothetical protein BDE02_02G001300 [Populus trichocarpa]|nr:hypothetical protein BDE02_02G001300 [Populus trichocarpa]